MDISARAFSLADRPRRGHLGHQCSHAPGRPILHLVSSSRRPRRVGIIGLHHRVLISRAAIKQAGSPLFPGSVIRGGRWPYSPTLFFRTSHQLRPHCSTQKRWPRWRPFQCNRVRWIDDRCPCRQYQRRVSKTARRPSRDSTANASACRRSRMKKSVRLLRRTKGGGLNICPPARAA